jgi:hypothetical protein
LTKILIVKRARFAGVERGKREKLKAGSTENMFTTEDTEGTEVKPESANVCGYTAFIH